MSPEEPPEGEFIDRRSGKDRRANPDRRRAGRRHRRAEVSEERRSGTDRRGPDRRSGVDRRIFNDPRYRKPKPRDAAPRVYSAEQAAAVRHMLSHIGHRPACPVCGGGFTLGPVDRRGPDVVRQASCADCGRGTVVTNCLVSRIMILTGIDAIAAMLRTTLAGVGHDVVRPPTTAAALDLYRENPPDLVMLDAHALTEMDGQEFIRRLQREVADPRIVVLTPRPSYGRADPSAAAQQLGATRILRLPCNREDLLRTVKEARP